MKKVLMCFVLILITFCINMNVRAEGKFISCESNTIAPGGSVNCNVIGTRSDNATVGSIEFNLSADDLLTVGDSVSGASGFSCSSGDRWGCMNDNGINSGGNVGTFTITASESAAVGDTATVNITVYQVAAVDSSIAADEDEQTDSVTLTIGDGNGSENGSSDSVSENPKTIDTNTFAIIGLLSAGLIAVFVSRKKLVKIGK